MMKIRPDRKTITKRVRVSRPQDRKVQPQDIRAVCPRQSRVPRPRWDKLAVWWGAEKASGCGWSLAGVENREGVGAGDQLGGAT